MRLVVLGAGGLGSVIGGYLAEAGVDVTLICRQAHADAINANGLSIVGQRGEHLVNKNITACANADEAEGHFDYMMLAVKSKDTHTALAGAASLIDRVDTFFSVQNNLVKEAQLADWCGDSTKVMGASTIEGGYLVAPGEVNNHMTVDCTAYFGELDGTISPRVEAIVEVFNKGGLPTKAVTYIQQVLWEKLTQIANASTYAVSTLAGNTELDFVHGLVVREGAEHYVAIARELLSVYTAQGYEPQNFYAPISRLKQIYAIKEDNEAVETMLAMGKQLQDSGYKGTTSMHDDVLRGRKTEADDIIKPFIDKAAELGLQVPTITACYRIIKVLDAYLK